MNYAIKESAPSTSCEGTSFLTGIVVSVIASLIVADLRKNTILVNPSITLEVIDGQNPV